MSRNRERKQENIVAQMLEQESLLDFSTHDSLYILRGQTIATATRALFDFRI